MIQRQRVMPVYEFHCNGCQRRLSIFTKSIANPPSLECSYCGSKELSRVISSFAYHKSEQDRLEELGPPQSNRDHDYFGDPRNIGRWTEQRLREMEPSMQGEEFRDVFAEAQEMIAAARDGELPESIKDL